MSLSATHQQHLRTLRRHLNRAVTAVKAQERVVVHTGWEYGRAFSHPRLSGQQSLPWPEEQELHLLFPEPDGAAKPSWQQQGDLVPEELWPALDFFWPGPLVVSVRCRQTQRRIKLACPWHPLIKEMLSRSGCCLWVPLSSLEQGRLAGAQPAVERDSLDGEQTLVWPDPEFPLRPTYFDASTVPWRLVEIGFVTAEELRGRIGAPFLLSEERAFPKRSLRTFVPGYRTVVLEAASKTELPQLVMKIREAIGVDWSLRIYLEESVAHTHFPDDRHVRVYGEMKDPERVRRRLEAMLERQRRRSGRRVLLIGVAELDASADSLKADLRKVADRWLQIPAGETVEIDDFR